MIGYCKTCGQKIMSRASSKASAQANFLKAMRKHYKKKHPTTIGRRISRGLRNKHDNPDLREFVETLQESPKSAVEIYKKFHKKQRIHIRRTMLALSPVLPKEVTMAWAVIDAIHGS